MCVKTTSISPITDCVSKYRHGCCYETSKISESVERIFEVFQTELQCIVRLILYTAYIKRTNGVDSLYVHLSGLAEKLLKKVVIKFGTGFNV